MFFLIKYLQIIHYLYNTPTGFIFLNRKEKTRQKIEASNVTMANFNEGFKLNCLNANDTAINIGE
jgi:hypothetical protein